MTYAWASYRCPDCLSRYMALAGTWKDWPRCPKLRGPGWWRQPCNTVMERES